MTQTKTNAAIREGHELVYIHHTTGWQSIQVKGRVGGRGPLHTTAMGKVLLAHLEDEERDLIMANLSLERETPNSITDINEFRQELEQTRQRGYGITDCEHELLIRAISVPILVASHFVYAALFVAGPAF